MFDGLLLRGCAPPSPTNTVYVPVLNVNVDKTNPPAPPPPAIPKYPPPLPPPPIIKARAFDALAGTGFAILGATDIKLVNPEVKVE